jgi:hypothetical protein
MSSPHRSAAYGRVMQTLADLGPAKLLPVEQDTIREAADALLFTADPLGDVEAVTSAQAVEHLARHLVESGRWTAERADQLVTDVLACAPGVEVLEPQPQAA